MYITREFDDKIISTFRKGQEKGLILAGIVGCGKTTLVKHSLEKLGKETQVFSYTGDDFQFRARVAEDTKFIYQDIL